MIAKLLAAALIVVIGCGTTSEPVPPSEPFRHLTLFAGQSNAVGIAKVAEIDPALTEPYPEVTLYARVQRAAQDPTYPTLEIPLGPRGDTFGAELTLGRAVPDRDIVKCAIGGSSLAVHWDPDGSYPEGLPNLYSQCRDFALSVPGVVTEILWFQGESDQKTEADALAYGDNLVYLSARMLADFPCARFYYYRLHSTGGGNTFGPFSDHVRDGQDAAAAGEWMHEVNVDALPMYGLHFTSQGYLELGELFAEVISGQEERCDGAGL